MCIKFCLDRRFTNVSSRRCIRRIIYAHNRPRISQLFTRNMSRDPAGRAPPASQRNTKTQGPKANRSSPAYGDTAGPARTAATGSPWECGAPGCLSSLFAFFGPLRMWHKGRCAPHTDSDVLRWDPDRDSSLSSGWVVILSDVSAELSS